MRTIVKGKNYDVPDRVREYAERKLSRLERFLDDRSDATVELSVEQHRSAEHSHIVEVTLVIDGQALRGSASAPTHRAGIDEVVDKIERRAVDYRQKLRTPGRGVGNGSDRGDGAGAETTEQDDRRGQIVKTKRFDIEPMFEEDAVARMEELGHAFFVFVNAENERIAILYRRKAGDYGLIEPMIGGDYTKGGPPGRSVGATGRSGNGTARR
ncbi:MAG TPA: ribosome-associated translation inhibitor RaiA [Candidatus Limnocylindrales bacterium]|nr:ribosome-associated translation inhibitor RaiA [Candidatus Limnocylindrales bacterium]